MNAPTRRLLQHVGKSRKRRASFDGRRIKNPFRPRTGLRCCASRVERNCRCPRGRGSQNPAHPQGEMPNYRLRTGHRSTSVVMAGVVCRVSVQRRPHCTARGVRPSTYWSMFMRTAVRPARPLRKGVVRSLGFFLRRVTISASAATFSHTLRHLHPITSPDSEIDIVS